jgi:hypothetical protein
LEGGDGVKDTEPAPAWGLAVDAFNSRFASAVALGERWPVIRTGVRDIIPAELRKLIWHRDGGRCTRCWGGRRLVQLDHIIPWSAGGPDTAANLRLMCAPCNKERSNFRTGDDDPATPVTRACDECIRGWVRRYGLTRFGRIVPGAAGVQAYCGNCGLESMVTDPARLM